MNAPTPGPTRRRAATARRGVSLVEILFSVAALGMATAVIVSALSYTYTRQKRERLQLACAELANRIVLMYLDDPKSTIAMPDLVAYDGDLFRFSLEESVVRVEENNAVADARSRQSRNEVSKRLLVYTVTVWLSEESGGTQFPVITTPSHTLARLYDPISSQRNLDSVERRLNSGDLSEYTSELLGTGRATRTRSGTGGGSP